jgi:hypothetical protein
MQEIRRDNLRRLAVQWGGVGKLAEKLGYANASFLVQMCGPHPIREVTERTARRVEETLSLPKGWLDTNEHDEPKVHDGYIVELVKLVAAEINAASVTVSPDKFADLVILIHGHCESLGKIDPTFVRQMVGLLK